VLPRHIARLVSAAAEVATALRHEPSGPRTDSATSGHIVRPSRPGRPLVAATTAQPSTAAQSPRPAPVLAAFVDLLVDHGANQAVTVAALDRLADLVPVTRPVAGNGQPAATPSSPSWASPLASAVPSSNWWPALAACATTGDTTPYSARCAPRSNGARISTCRHRSGAVSPPSPPDPTWRADERGHADERNWPCIQLGSSPSPARG
jgi:hypothetical protein